MRRWTMTYQVAIFIFLKDRAPAVLKIYFPILQQEDNPSKRRHQLKTRQ